MKLVPVKCPDCGADIKIPDGSSSVACEYCGGNILVTDILGSTSVMQNCMMLAFSAMESKNYKDAYDHFNRAIEIDLKNPNAWFGKAVCTGMTGKLNKDSFGQMIELFETSFNYTSKDKQPGMRKNASVEIVKAIRKSQKLIQLGVGLLDLQLDAEFGKSVADEENAIKEKVKTTCLKALEYDPANKVASSLLDEITSGKFFESESEETRLKAVPPPNINPSASSQTENKKGGCSLVLIVVLIVLGLLLELR